MSDLLFVLDTETTGLLSSEYRCQTRPVQFGGVALLSETMAEVSYLDLLLCPDVWRTSYKHAEKIHGIPRARCEAEGRSMAAGWAAMDAWMSSVVQQHPGLSIRFLAWNAGFDQGVLDRWGAAAAGRPGTTKGEPWPDWQQGILDAPGGCLMRMWASYSSIIGLDTKKSLNAAVEALGLDPRAGCHDALEDARLAAAVLRTLWERENDPSTMEIPY